MASEVVWLPRAKLHLDDQLDYLETRNPRAAFVVAQAVTKAKHRARRKPSTRELVVTGTPFLLVSRVDSDAIVILRFLRGAQRWPEAEAGAQAWHHLRHVPYAGSDSGLHSPSGCRD